MAKYLQGFFVCLFYIRFVFSSITAKILIFYINHNT